MDDAILLISSEMETDENGVEHAVRNERQVFCRKQSVTRAEFFDGGRAGLNPEYMFTVFAGDYLGEDELVYAGRAYGIYRTYHPEGSDYIELYAARKGGVNGKGNTT